MNSTKELFLNALSNAIHNRENNWTEDITLEQWRDLYRLASIHDVVSLFVHSVYQNESLQELSVFRNFLLRKATSIAACQAQRSADFTLLYQKMREQNLKPLVIKGIICRSLYPNPEQRPSTDEDILIFPYQIEKYHRFFMENGFRLYSEDTNIERADEVSYINDENHLYLEVHKYLFPTNAPAYGDLNSLFSVLEKHKTETIYHTDFKTFGYTDHLLYMFCHAYKHFLYSGIGIRQICDIVLFTEKYGSQVDWERIYDSCKAFRIDKFIIAIMNIAIKHLGLQADGLPIFNIWDSDSVDESALLEDILIGGIYGTADEDRTHSSTMTLEVVSAQKEGRKSRSIVKTVFPSPSYMQAKYPYIRKNKWLLPAAWAHRSYDYLKSRSHSKTNPVKTLEIGNNRIGLLRKYKIID